MQQAPILLVIGLSLSALLCTYLASWACLHARMFGAREVGFLLFGVAVYSLGYAMEISRSDINDILVAINFEYIGLSFLPSLLMLFTLNFVREKPVSKKAAVILLLIPCFTLAIVFTQKYHNLYYVNPHVVYSGLFPALGFERGIWYYVYLVFQQICALSAVVILAKHALCQKKRQKNQTIMIIIGALIPIISGTIYYLGYIPYNLDVGPFSFTVTGVIFAIAIFKMGFLELVPAARELAMDAINDAFIVVDKEGILQDFNQAALNLPGVEKIEIGYFLGEDDQIGRYLQPLLQKKEEIIEFSAISINTGKRYYQAKAYKVLKKQTHLNGMAILIRDVTETARLLRKLSYEANVDGLTGILNRRELMQQAAKEIQISSNSGLPLGIILIDLDHFKNINDTHGHTVGDEVLKRVAYCFRSGLREIDIFGRYGGEEFVILLPGAGVEDPLRVAERLRKNLQNNEFLIDGKKINLTASFGVHTVQAKSDTTMIELLAVADNALYQAKANGRNQVARSS